MKNILKVMFFLMYTIGIFLIPSYYAILWGIGINIICMIIQKISIKNALINLYSFMGFILFTGIINIFAVDFYYGSVIAIKLIIVCNMTYIFAKSVTYMEFAETIANIISPLKYLKIDTNHVKILICIALASIPILKQELTNVKFALKAKGAKIDAIHLILQLKWVLLPIITSILKRINEIEYTLRAKSYEGD